jgi:glycosyltransferase involved in cell wall biosynthesis
VWIDISTVRGWLGTPHGIARVEAGLATALARQWPESRPVWMADGRLVVGDRTELQALSDGGSSSVPGFDIAETVPAWVDPEVRRGVVTMGIYGRRARLAMGLRLAASALPARVGAPVSAGAADLSRRMRRRPRHDGAGLDPRIGADDIVLVTGADWASGVVDTLRRTPASRRPRVWVLVHDLLPVSHPELLCNDRLSTRFRAWLRSVAVAAERVLLVSEASRREFDDFLARERLAPVATSVLRPAVSPTAAQPTGAPAVTLPDGPYVVYVSTVERRKNHVVLVQAVRSALRRGAPIPHVVLVGSWGWGTDDLRQELTRDAVLGSSITHLDGLPDETMRRVVGGSAAVVFPSRFEGFGLPAAEAREWGRPVIAADIPSLHEVLGPYAWFVDPDDSGAWRDALVRVGRGDRPPTGAAVGRTWVEVAEELIALMRGPSAETVRAAGPR